MNINSHLAQRKKKHLEICTQPQNYSIESGLKTGFEELGFLYTALPELDETQVDTREEFIGYPINFPFMISCMTGGSEHGFKANKTFARAAQKWRIPVGLGSMRILFEEPTLIEDFQIKKLAPDVPVLANLSLVQLKHFPTKQIVEMLKRLEVQGLVLHVNLGQELYQTDGDRDFSGLWEALQRFRTSVTQPLIIKETGFGFDPNTIKKFFKLGVDYVDIAGCGGTNWILVESYRYSRANALSASEFRDWGYPTALLLDLIDDHKEHIIASGGLRGGMDVAKSLALGARMTAAALPIIQAFQDRGFDGVDDYLAALFKTLRSVMVLTSSQTLQQLRATKLVRSERFVESAAALKAALQI